MNKSVEKVWLLALFSIPVASANNGNGLAIANNNVITKNNLIASNKIAGLSTIASSDSRYGNISIVSSNSQGYASYFELNEKTIDVSIAGLNSSSIALKGGLSFFKAKIDESERRKLKNYLIDAGIKKQYIEEILNALSRGIDGSRECKGKKSECVILSSELEAVVDYYNNSLRLFLPSTMFETNDESIVLETRSESMLVSNMYASVSHNKDLSYFVRSSNVLGAGEGYFKADFNVNKNSNYVDQLNFNLDQENFTATAGLISNTSRLGVAGYESIFNQNYYGAEISNQKLLEIKNFASKGVDFFSASDGLLSVYNDNGDLIYQENIRSGMNSIPYSMLPYGSYPIRYEVTKNGNVVSKAENFISNTDAFDASKSSYYVRFGAVADSKGESTAPILVDVGASLPTYSQQSITANAAIIEGEAFFSAGYYANINDITASAKYSISNNASQVDASLYGRHLSFSVSDTHVSTESFLGEENNLSATLSGNYNVDRLNLGTSVTYGESGDLSYLSYNANASYSFSSGVNLYASYNRNRDENTYSVGLSIPFADNARYSGTVTVNDANTELVSSLYDSYEVNDELSIMGSISHSTSKHRNNKVEANATGHYRNEHLSGSSGIQLYENNRIGYSGSLNTTAYITRNDFYLKNSVSEKTSAIEVNQTGKSLDGKIKIKDKVSGYTSNREVKGSGLFELKSYSMATLGYEFENDNHALIGINIDQNEVVSLLPGKIHYVDVNQQPIGSVLIVNASLGEPDFICTGDSCVNEASVNDRVTKFKVIPNEPVSISRNGLVCFDGKVEFGQTKMGVCK